MKKTDSRVRYSKMVLREALLKILQTKHIDKVTVKELCQEANVNRGTFYQHYVAPNDLLMEIERQFIDENMAYFSPYMNEGYEASQLSGMFACILKNKEMCRIIMGNNGNPRFLERLQEMVREGVVEGWCKEYPDYTRSDLNHVFNFIFSGSMRMILDWIEDDQGMSTADLASRLDRLAYHCHLAIPEFGKEKWDLK